MKTYQTKTMTGWTDEIDFDMTINEKIILEEEFGWVVEKLEIVDKGDKKIVKKGITRSVKYLIVFRKYE